MSRQKHIMLQSMSLIRQYVYQLKRLVNMCIFCQSSLANLYITRVNQSMYKLPDYI